MEGLEGKDIVMKSKQKPSRPYEKFLNERLSDPAYAIEYLNSILEENDPNLLLLGLNVARAYLFCKLTQWRLRDQEI